jgi:hypothetical protein
MKQPYEGTTTLDEGRRADLGPITGTAAGVAGAQDEYWRGEWQNRDYVDVDGYDYETDYRPAYRYGWESRVRHADRDWDDRMEAEMSQEWNELKGGSRLTWEKAKHAVKDAWHRVERAMPGDLDRDGH